MRAKTSFRCTVPKVNTVTGHFGPLNITELHLGSRKRVGSSDIAHQTNLRVPVPRRSSDFIAYGYPP